MEDKTEKMPNASETKAIPRSHETDGEATEAEKGMDTNQDGGSNAEGFSETSFSSKRRKFIPIIAGAAAVLLIAGGTAFALNQPPAADPAPKAVEEVTQAADNDQKPEKKELPAFIEVDVDDAYLTDGMTPVIAHITGDSDGVKGVDYYTAIDKRGVDKLTNSAEIKVIKGEKYKVEYVDAITPDGGLINVHTEDRGTSSVTSLGVNDYNPTRANPMAEFVKPEDVTQEQIDQVLDQLKDAVAKGDETLTGEKGQAVIDAAANNAAANPNIDKDKVAEKAEEAKQNVSDTPNTSTGGSNGNTDSNAGTSSGSTTDSNSSNGSASNNSSSSSSSSGNSSQATNPTPAPAPAPAPAPTPQPDPAPAPAPAPAPEPPAHVHSWYTVTDVPASYAWQASDGYVAYTMEDYKAYAREHQVSWTTIESSPAQTHQECSCGARS